MNSKKEGESSNKSENDGNEKPLKKARYAWEVKGKYHLKDKSKTVNPNCGETSQVRRNNESNEAAEAKTGCKCDVSSVKLLMSRADRIMDFDIPVDTFQNNDASVQAAMPDEQGEDYYLLRWQARQLAKGFVDNTINRVLEQWRLSIHASDLFVGNCDSDELVEDEGILMAIQSHGLKQETNQQSFYSDSDNLENLLDNTNMAFPQSSRSPTEGENSISYENVSGSGKKIDDVDFLNAAVSVAISNKGLSSCSYE